MRIEKNNYYISGADLIKSVPQYDNKIGVTILYPHKRITIVQSCIYANKLIYYEAPRYITDTSLIICRSLTFPGVLSAQRFLFRGDLIACIRKIRRKTKFLIL